MNTRLSSLRLVLIAVCALLIWCVSLPASAQDGTSPSTPAPDGKSAIAEAWQLAQASGTYDYRSLVSQTSFPAPSLTNAGRAPTETNFGVEGSVDLSADALEMTMWRDASFDPARGISMRVEGDTAYGRVGQGEWKEVQNVSDAFAPGGDPLGFLAGVKNVAAAGEDTRSFGDDAPTLHYTRYTFEVDGDAFGAFVRSQLEAKLREDGSLPAGVTLETPQVYQDMLGTGEIWLDDAGLPARLTVDMELPDYKAGSRTHATITNDYWGYDHQEISLNTTPIWENPLTWLSRHLPHTDSDWGRITVYSVLGITFLVTVFLSIRTWRLKQFYIAVVGAVILSMLVSPLMRSEQVYAFSEEMNAEQATQDTAVQEQTDRNEQMAQAQAAEQPAWNPQRDPMTPLPPAIAELKAGLNSPTLQGTDTDTDSDGLSDSDELLWGSCPYAASGSTYCVGVTNPKDSDADGFEDGTEVNQLGTLPSRADSDSDGISDYLEVKGFTYNGTTWYLNPNEEDSNYDGMLDGYDCPVWNSTSTTFNANGSCPDTDKDGTPDLFDDDNDGDEVDDGADLSPSATGSTVYDDDTPLELKFSNLKTDTPVILTLQFHPSMGSVSNQGLVLDWPSDDEEGHITRHLDTTFATTANSDALSSDVLAGNGDVRLTPLLEITMPYTTGHYANLPINSTYAGTTRTTGVGVDEWLDADALDMYGVDLQDVDETSGDLVAYLPLATDTDSKGDEAVAFNARMLYYPTQGTNGVANWGEAHQFRLIWLVQMLQDSCVNPEDEPSVCVREDSFKVVHVYTDDMVLTGVQVEEEHGTDVSILYENPTVDNNLSLDDHLWSASWNLSNTFLRGRDCDSFTGNTCQSNGTRDVTVANMATTIDNWSSGTNYVAVSTPTSYDHYHEAIDASADVMKTILDTSFNNYKTQTAPTLLMTMEHASRTLTLGNSGVSSSSNLITFNFNPASVLETTSVGMSWQPYNYVDGEWTAYDTEDYLTYLDEQVQNDEFFQPEDDSSTAAEEVQGKRLWAQYYYALLYRGLTAIAEIDGNTTWAASDGTENIPEQTYEAVEADVSLVGLTFVGGYYAFIAIEAIKAATTGGSFSGTIWSGMLRDGNTYSFGKSALIGTGLMAGLFVTAAIGVGLYVAGYITGNGTLVEIGTWVLTVTAVLSPTIWLITMMVQITTAVRAGVAAGASLATMGNSVMAISKGFPVFPAAMLAVTIGITLVLFFYTLSTLDLKNNPADLYALIAFTLASIIVQILLFALAYIPVIGQILVVLILVIDAILAGLGLQTMQGWLTEKLADALFDYDDFLKIDDPERLTFSPAGTELVDEELGFTVSNAMTYSLQVTNTMQADEYSHKDFPTVGEPTAWQAIKYSTFRYFLQDDTTPHHSGLHLEDMNGEWDKLSDKSGRTVDTVANRFPFSATGTGINQNFSGSMYLVESYAAPYVLCFNVYIGILRVPACSWHAFKASNPINVGQYVTYDILPDTVADFVDVKGWNGGDYPAMAFPQQKDQDGDGLLSIAQGGVDPNDQAHDSDGDGLSDVYEASYGSDISSADSDGDGLNDADEITANTDPFDADSDNDGLSDYTELMEGWVYAFPDATGTYIRTRVWSDPLNSDADNDTLSDLEEFVFGTHPQVATDPSFIKDIIKFDNLTVEEPSSLQLLARFKESVGATVFTDQSGNDYTPTCVLAAGSCPTAGVDGRYGNGLQFDGGDTLNTGANVTDFGKADFSVAAWVKTTGTNVAILTSSDGDATWEAGEKSFYLDGSGMPAFVGYGNDYIRSTVAVNDGEWHHVAATWVWTASGFQSQGGTARMYVDGVDVTTASTNYRAHYNNNTTDTLRIGESNHSSGEAQNNFSGTLDEVAVFDTELGAAEVTALSLGRYNPSDLILQPDTTLTYSAVVTNTHGTQGSDGLLTADTRYVQPEIVDPTVQLHFEQDEQIWSVANGTGDSTTLTCLGDGTCPTIGAEGKYDDAVSFDGDDDVMTMPYLGEAQSKHTLGFWLKVDSLPPVGEKAMILDTTRDGTGDLDIYLTSAGNIVFDVEGAVSSEISHCTNGASPCTYTPTAGAAISQYSFSGNLGTWVHFLWEYSGTSTILYVNTAEYWDTLMNHTTLPALQVGPGTIGNDSSNGYEFDGSLDELVFYNNDTVPQTTSLQSYRPMDQMKAGNYWLGTAIANVSDHVPTFLARFSEDPAFDPTPLEFHNTDGTNLTCDSQATCPTLTTGYDDFGISFDGVNDYLPYTDQENTESQAITMWVKADTLPTGSNTATLVSTNATGDSVQLYISSNGRVTAKRDTSLHTSTVAITPGVWTKVSIRYFETRESGNWIYKSEFYFNDVYDNFNSYASGSNNPNEPTRIGPGRIGNSIAGTSPFDGMIDEIIIDNIVTTDFDVADDAEVAFLNAATDGRSAFCEDTSVCPTVGTDSPVVDGITLDGVDDYLAIGETDFARGDYTVGIWFKSSASGVSQRMFSATDSTDNAGLGLELQANGTVRFLHRFPTASSGGVEIISPSAYNDGQWHYATAVLNDELLSLYVDGTLVGTQNGITDHAPSLLDITIGRLAPANADRFFNGSLDELVMIPAATDAEGVTFLMDGRVPAITVDDDFITFSAAALTSTEISGTFSVAADIPTSVHRFDEEVEAALQLSQDITIPVIDDRAANLLYFLPFEDVPASTIFENVVSAVEQVCSGDYCPTAGLRGKVDRAAYFDGVNDYIQTNNLLSGGAVVSVAAWVNADRGTILDMSNPAASDYGGIRLDVNRFRIVFDDGSSDYQYYELPITLPENEWAHVAATYNSSTKVASVYVNGTLQTSQTLSDTGSRLDNRPLRIGLSKNGVDGLHGYLDDLRMYNVTLTAAEVQSLYLESAAVMRFEFDEDGDATSFADSSINAYSGVPTLKSCVPFVLGAVTIDSMATSGQGLYAYFDGAQFMQESDVTGGTTFTPSRTWTVCGGEKLEFGFIDAAGVATSVGSYTLNAANIATVAASSPPEANAILTTMSSGGNSITLVGSLNPEPVYVPNPAPGTDGQIGNTALFDGSGAIEIEAATALNSLTNDFTVIGWINPEQLIGTQQILAAGQDSSNNGFAFGVNSDKLRFSALGGTTYNSTYSLDANAWQQVAIVFDSSNDANFYVDGVLQNTALGNTPITVNGDDSWFIGAAHTGAITQAFTGQIDELSVYSRSLSEEEITSIYLRELRWYRARSTAYLTIDTTPPTMNLLSPEAYYADGYIQLAMNATDVGSDVEVVDFGVKTSGDSDYTWSGAPICRDGIRAGSAYCPYFTSDGEGRYMVRFRAVDSVGNNAYSEEYVIYVDDTGPIATSDYNGEWQELQDSVGIDGSWTIPLFGNVTDPNLSTNVGGSGVYSQNIRATLKDGSGAILNGTTQEATFYPGDNMWAVDYRIDGEEPTGKYTVWVTARDVVGNESTQQVGVIQLDGRDPQVDLDYWSMPVVVTDTTILRGTVTEQPRWEGLVDQYHFEELFSETIHDSSYYEQHATCSGTGCPLSGTGVFGQALRFDGSDDGLVATDVFTDGSPIDLNTLALSLWLYPTDPSGANGRAIVSKSDATGDNTNYALSFAPNSYNLSFTADNVACDAAIGTLQSTTSLPPETWSHVGVTYDGTTVRFYINGIEDSSTTWGGDLCQSNAELRMGVGGGLTPFAGSMDEVRVFDRALSDAEVYALAQSIVSGVTKVEVALEPIDLDSEEVVLDNLTWNNTTIATPNIAGTRWNYTVPANTPEGIYSVYARARDAFNNESPTSGVWRGIIDRQAPRVTFDATTFGDGTTQYTEYSFTIDDILLDPASVEQVCEATDIVYDYYDATTLAATGATGGCRVEGALETDASITACDTVGHCTTETVNVTTPRVDVVAILTPRIYTTRTGLDPLTIGGVALSADGIQTLDVTANGVTVYTETWGSGVAGDVWTTQWTPPSYGTYELEATLTTYSNNTITDPFTHIVKVNAPELSISKSVTPTTDVRQGDTLTYTIILTNSGNLTATNVVVTDVLPDGVNGTNLDETVTLGVGDVLSFTIPAEVSGQSAETITNTAYFTHTWQQGNDAATFDVCDVQTVTNANDSGPGSLRQAIADVCAPGLIRFTGDFDIHLNSTLALTKDLTFNAFGHDVTLSGDSGNDGDRDIQVMTVASGVNVTLYHIVIEDGVASGGGGISNNGTLRLVDSTVNNNYTTNGNNSGGGISNSGALYLDNVSFTGNSAGLRGGAIFSSGTMTITASTFTDNEVRPPFGLQRGGAIFNEGSTASISNSRFEENTATQGGAIYQANRMTITTSTFLSNTANLGGGIYNDNQLTVNNSTFVANTATNTTYGGGGIYNHWLASTVTVNNSTFTDNVSGHEGGAIYNYVQGTLYLNNSVLGNSTGDSDCFDFLDSPNVTTTNTLIERDSSCFATMSANPLVGDLGDYGGSQHTAPLLPGSPAIDAGDDATCTTTDQRGISRKGVCDMGSFESQGFALTYESGSDQSAPLTTQFAEPLEAVVTANESIEPVEGGEITYTAPTSGATTSPLTTTATIDTNGIAGGIVTANDVAGTYTVEAEANGVIGTADFDLTNTCSGLAFTVTSSDDDGAGTLRRGINNLCSGGTISFDVDMTIALSSTLTVDKSLAISGNGHTIIISGDTDGNGTPDVQPFVVATATNLTLHHLTIEKGTAVTGGAVLNAGSLTMDTVTVRDSTATVGGGVASTTEATALIIANSTLSGNSATSRGGAVYSAADTSIINSTISGNSAPDGAAVATDAALTLTSTTIADNDGTGVDTTGTPITFRNSIIAGSSGDECVSTATVTTDNHTLIEDGSCDVSLSGDPLLAPLDNYGGDTQTHALLPGSPALNTGNNTVCMLTDQRGISRVGSCDIGAFESQGFTLSYVSGTNQRTSINTNFGVPLKVQVTANSATEPVGTGGRVQYEGPSSDASISPSLVFASTDGSGVASLTATANAITGTYQVTATVVGGTGSAVYDLSNYNCAYPEVINDNDSGLGSLRGAIADACTGAHITFTDNMAIYLDSPLSTNKTLTIDASNRDITVSGDSNNDGSRNVQPFRIMAGGVVTITHLSVISGTSSNTGGGAIYNEATLTVSDSHFQNNTSTTGGGGGAIYTSSYLTVTGSTFLNNTAEIGAGISNPSGQVVLVNSTFANNASNREGGAINNRGSLVSTNNTFVSNTAFFAGGIYNRSGGTLVLNNTLFDNNSGGLQCHNVGLLSGGNNLSSGSNTCGAPTSNSINLSALGEYGGDTQTFALQLGSAAIDAGNSTICAAAPINNVDQRGEPRLVGSSCDIGAFEAVFMLARIGGNNQSTNTGQPFADPLQISIFTTNNAPIGTYSGVTFTGPTDGASISSPVTASPDEDGLVSVNVSANNVAGSYQVKATTPGAVAPVLFTLTNVYVPGSITIDDATFGVDEDAANDTELGYIPTDNQTGNDLTYHVLSGNDDGVFALGSDNGRLSIADDSTLDYETTPEYLLEVEAGDGIVTDTATITVTVNNMMADLTISKDVTPYEVAANGLLTYTLDFYNYGREVAEGVVVTDIMPSEVTVLSVEATSEDGVMVTEDGTDPYRWLVSDLEPDDEAFITIIVQVDEDITVSEILNRASISTTSEEDNTDDNESQVSTPLCLADMTVTSNADSGDGTLRDALEAVCRGGTVTFDSDMTIRLESRLEVNNSLTIDGSGHEIVLSGDAGVAGDLSDNVQVMGVFAEDGGLVTLRHLTIRDGKSEDGPAGVYITYANVLIEDSLITDNAGSGIQNLGTLTLRNSTVSNNVAIEGAGISNIFDGVMTIENSTISGNRADESGGGILNYYATMTITHSTIVSNTANFNADEYGGGGGIYYGGDNSMVTVSASIVAGNRALATQEPFAATDNNCAQSEDYPDSEMVDGGYNLMGDTGDCITDSGTTMMVSRADLMDLVIEPLGNYGGDTPTHALRNGSPVIDMIPSAECTVETDQRGEMRGVGVAQGGTGCDAGAYEGFSSREIAGDVSCDATMNTVDGLFMLQYDVALRSAKYQCPLTADTMHLPSCDINNDSTCNAIDGLFLLQCDAGFSNSFCPAVLGGRTEEARATNDLLVSTITVGSGTIAETETQITIPIMIDTTDLVGAVNVRVTYDSTVVTVAGCAANPDGTFDSGFCNRTVQGRVTMNAISLVGVTGNGLRLATITFARAAGLTQDTTMPLPITISTFASPSGITIPATGVAGQLVVEAIPLAVTLANFEATAQPEQVLVAWETASEVDNLGFNVLRTDSNDLSAAVQLNNELILSQAPGGGQGASYEWDDTEVVAGTTYWYWLESVDVEGHITRFGPVSATFGAPTAVTVSAMTIEPEPRHAGLIAIGILGLLVGILVRRKYGNMHHNKYKAR